MAPPMTRAAIRGCLQSVALFSLLAEEELEALASSVRPMAVRRGARIFEEGSQADCCYLLTSGKARVVLSGDSGTEILLGVVLPNSLVGEVALLDGSPRSASLVADEDSLLIRISAAQFEQLRRNPAFERRLVAGLASTLREANDQVRGISTFPSIARVAWCLGRIARQEGRPDGKSVLIPKKPHHELAEMTGCTRETVSRALAALKRKKYVSWDAHVMRLEIEGLQRYVHREIGLPGRWM